MGGLPCTSIAAMLALGFEPALTELGFEVVRVPPVLLELKEEEGEVEEEDETDEEETLGCNRTDIPYVRFRFEYHSFKNFTRKLTSTFPPLSSALPEALEKSRFMT